MEKYTSTMSYTRARLSRAGMRTVLAPLVRWTPCGTLEEGYTLVIGVNSRLEPILQANLRMLARQKVTALQRVIVVLDSADEGLRARVERVAKERCPNLPVTVMTYSPVQAKTLKMLDWGWAYAWMSWCIGVGACTTPWLVLHDLDALLLDEHVIEGRYTAAKESGGEYIGMRYYQGGGITPEDKLCVTFELIFDIRRLRAEHRPIEVFNKVRRFNGRRVEMDTFLDVQSRSNGKKVVAPIDENLMVHPSQMICQFVDHVNGRAVPASRQNLLMIPYYYDIGGEPGLMAGLREQLRAGKAARLELFGHPVDATRLTPEHSAWYTKQSARLEQCLYGRVRDEVAEYFGRIAENVGK